MRLLSARTSAGAVLDFALASCFTTTRDKCANSGAKTRATRAHVDVLVLLAVPCYQSRILAKEPMHGR